MIKIINFALLCFLVYTLENCDANSKQENKIQSSEETKEKEYENLRKNLLDESSVYTDKPDDVKQEDYQAFVLDDQNFRFIKQKEYPELVELNASFTLKNNTSSRVTSFKIETFLLAQYRDELIFYPNDNSDGGKHETLDEFIKNGRFLVTALRNDDISIDEPWLPNTKKTFICKIYNSIDWHNGHVGFSKKSFQRTPETLDFVIRYKSISVDDEQADLRKYDVKDIWTNYQSKLNLR